MCTQKKTRRFGSLLLGTLIVLAAFAARLWKLSQTSLWYDEAFVLFHAQRGVLQAIAGLLLEDNALPFHGTLLALWVKLAGDSEFSARYLSVLLGTIGTPLVSLLALAVASPRRDAAASDRRRVSGLGAGLAYATLPILVYYGQEARMYALALPLAAGFAWTGWRLLRVPPRHHRHGVVALYATLGALTMAAHLYGGMMWAITGIWGTLTLLTTPRSRKQAPQGADERGTRYAVRQHKRWWHANVLLALVSLPIGLWALWRARADATAVTAIPLEALRSIPAVFGIGQYLEQPWPLIFSIATGGAVLAYAIHALRSRRTGSALWAIVSLVLPIVGLYLMTSVKAKWSERYLLPSWGIALVVLIGNGWEVLLRPRREAAGSLTGWSLISRIGGFLLAATWVSLAGLALGRQAEGTWSLMIQDEWHPRPDFRGVADYIETHDAAADAIVVIGGYASVAFDYYYSGHAQVLGLPTDSRILNTADALDLRALRVLDERAGANDRLWLVLWQDRIADPVNLVQSALVENCRRLPVGASFTNVGLLLFDTTTCRPLDQLARPPVAFSAAFEEPIQLVGYSLTATGQTWEVGLWWRTSGPIDKNWTVFVHLVDRAGNIIAQHDHIAGSDAHPTSQWREGTEMRDRFFLDVGDLDCVGCELRIGLYDEDGRLHTISGPDVVTLPVPEPVSSVHLSSALDPEPFRP